jgi:peptidoglycan hydrolase CwlO-like protein
MTLDMNQVKTALQRELDALQRIAEELNLKVALARADLKSELSLLDTKLRRAHEDIQRMNEHLKTPLHELESAVRALFADVRSGLDRVRHAFESTN